VERGQPRDQDSSDSAALTPYTTSLADNVRFVGRSVYIASPGGLTGESAIALGLAITAVQAQAIKQKRPLEAAAAGSRV
jgi:energy-converting hydrogenase Eha subunit F